MEDWLSVSQLSKIVEVPETSVRRYLTNFEEFFKFEQLGRGKKYHPSSIEILQRIVSLFRADRDTSEIKNILSNEYAFTITSEDEPIIPPAPYDVSKKLDDFRNGQEDFNQKLLESIMQQQNYIEELVLSRDNALNELKRLSNSEQQRVDRINQIVVEHKVKHLLEREALSKWNEKPEEERFIKVGWFRKEEDKESKMEFIRDYIDKNLQDYLKKMI